MGRLYPLAAADRRRHALVRRVPRRFFYPLHLAVAYPCATRTRRCRCGTSWGPPRLGRRDGGGRRRLAKTSLRARRLVLVPGSDAAGDLGIQIGPEADPDRFTYLPQIGIGIALAWAVADWTRTWRRQGAVCGLAAVAVLLALAARAAWQTSIGATARRCGADTLEFASANPIAHGKLGLALAGQGQFQEAIDEFQTVLRINPQDAGVHGNLGAVLGGLGASTKPSPSSGSRSESIPTTPRSMTTWARPWPAWDGSTKPSPSSARR